MRINKFLALATGLSRRAADDAIDRKRVSVNGRLAAPGGQVEAGAVVTLDGKVLSLREEATTIMLNKPGGYVVSRRGQGSQTIYDLLPLEFHQLKPVGRLDKNSSGLLLLTNNGQLAQELTHPSFKKEKVYEVELNKPLDTTDKARVEKGVMLDDGLSKFRLRRVEKTSLPHSLFSVRYSPTYEVRISEGRNRQIRRTFAALGYKVTHLHRTQFGDFKLRDLAPGSFCPI
jgi:pseudouridine synthase